MNLYLTCAIIKRLREQKNLTQTELAAKLGVSDKAVSKWETGKGYPDISLIEPLAAVLGISVIELMAGDEVINQNRSSNLKKVKFFVCPICGNVLLATGEAVISCCGVLLPPLEAEKPDIDHCLSVQISEDEYFLTVSHPMRKEHYISFIAAVRDNACELVKLYPEQEAQTRVKINRTDKIYWYCNRHGLFCANIRNIMK